MGEELTKTFNVKFTIPKSWDSLEVLNTMIQEDGQVIPSL